MINNTMRFKRLPVAFTLILFIFIVLGSYSHRLYAANTVATPLSVSENYYDLGQSLWYFEDPDGTLVFDDVISEIPDDRWQPSTENIPSFGYTRSAYWFRVTLQNPNPLPLKRVLEVAYPMLDDVGVYIKHHDNTTNRLHSGDRESFHRRSIKHRNFLFEINFFAHDQVDLYLRIRTNSALQVPLSLWHERDFWTSEQKELALQGIYFGIMLVMVLYNLFIYYSVRDETYLLYVLFISSFSLFQLTLHGLAYQYLWYWDPILNEQILMISTSASITFLSWFVVKALKTAESQPVLHKLINIVALAAAFNALATPFIAYSSSIQIAILLSTICGALCLAVGIIRWNDGYTPARYYTVAWFCLLVGATLFSLSKYGLLPSNFFTENAVQIGSALDAILLSFALADRINIAQQEKGIAQAQAVEMLRRYRSLYENTIEGIFQLSADYRLISVNQSMAEMLGFQNTEEMLSQKVNSLSYCFADADDADTFYRQLKETGKVIHFERQGCRRDGSLFWASWSARAVYDDQQNLLRIEGSLVDITLRFDKEQAELDREAANASSRAKSQFLATMSHEIRTPMNGMLGMIELLRMTKLDDTQVRYAETARRSGEQLLAIINDILDFSKIEVNKLELEHTEFELTLLLEDLRSLYQPQTDEKQLQLTVDYPPIAHDYLLRGDSLRLRQVLSNLLSNAIKFTEHGSVALNVLNQHETEQGITLCFVVEDTGIGIASEAQANVFEAFSQADGSTTRKFGGTGLGLTICKRLVSLMGGDIQLTSEPNKGSCFSFTITLEKILRTAAPAAQEKTLLSNSSLSPSSSSGGTSIMTDTSTVNQPTRRVLLVEDNATNQMLAIAMLENLEFDVDLASNGLEALEAFEQNHYQMILMDCQMPEMDGFEATRSIRQREQLKKAQPVPIIALTANAFASDRERCLAVGMNDYLAKPFSIDQLSAKLSIYLDENADVDQGEITATAKVMMQ